MSDLDIFKAIATGSLGDQRARALSWMLAQGRVASMSRSRLERIVEGDLDGFLNSLVRSNWLSWWSGTATISYAIKDVTLETRTMTEGWKAFWPQYPNRKNARLAKEAYKQAFAEVGADELLKALGAYKAKLESEKTELRYVMRAEAFLGGRWREFTPKPTSWVHDAHKSFSAPVGPRYKGLEYPFTRALEAYMARHPDRPKIEMRTLYRGDPYWSCEPTTALALVESGAYDDKTLGGMPRELLELNRT